MKKQIQEFLNENKMLTLATEYPEITSALYEIDDALEIFYNYERGVVELHDTKIVGQGSLQFKEPYVSWKIYHDALKYNSRNFDAVAFEDEEWAMEDRKDLMQRRITQAQRKAGILDTLYRN